MTVPADRSTPVSHAELSDRLGHHVTKGDLDRRLHSIDRRIRAVEKKQTTQGETMAASQADIDALAAALHQEDSDLNTAVTGIQAEIDALKQANPSLDVTALQSEVTSMGTAVSSAAALVPPPAPAGP